METKRDLILLVVKPFIITTFKLTCVRSFVRLEVRTLGVDLVASFGVALVYLAVLGEIIVAAVGRRIGGGGASKGGGATAPAPEINPAEAAAVLARCPESHAPEGGI